MSMQLPGNAQGRIGDTFTNTALLELVACPDCASETYWKFLGPGVFHLMIAHDETCPAMHANQQKGPQP